MRIYETSINENSTSVQAHKISQKVCEICNNIAPSEAEIMEQQTIVAVSMMELKLQLEFIQTSYLEAGGHPGMTMEEEKNSGIADMLIPEFSELSGIPESDLWEFYENSEDLSPDLEKVRVKEFYRKIFYGFFRKKNLWSRFANYAADTIVDAMKL